MNYQHLIDTATALGCGVTLQAPMSAATTFKVGGPADLLIDIPSADAAAQVLRTCREDGIPYLFIGNGSNLVFGDKGYRGAVLRLDSRKATATLRDDTTIYAPAGMSLQRLCLFARDHSLTGLEFAYGIPGTVGGAVYMNAGAYDSEMVNVVQSADCITAEGALVTIPAADLAMTYRHTALMESDHIVVGATLRLQAGDKDAIWDKMKDFMARRHDKQPLEFPSAGSFFKRPVGHFAGKLIQDAGLKGFTVGGAQVSEKHAGFVINRGGATAADLVELCRRVQEKVLAEFGVQLEPEVRFVGEF